jgi:hypothetical protein
MSYESNVISEDVLFKDFIFRNKRNRTILWIAVVAIIVQYGIFKYLYPFASYIHGDSFSYIKAAYFNLNVNTYMIGYSRFLRIFSVFSSSDFILSAFQYLFIHFSALFLLLTIFYFYNIYKLTKIILILFIIVNPLFLHLGNLISSDCLFTALSILWFTLLLWIIYKPSKFIIVAHSLTLLILFTYRYNALIYPIISIIAFIISPLNIYKKLTGGGLGIVLCLLFVLYTSNEYKKLTGYWQYSPFSGWQLANNSMYAYRYVDSSIRKPVPHRFEALNKMINEYFDSSRNIFKHPQETLLASTAYMWDKRSTLYIYRDKLFQYDSSSSEFKKWAYMGDLFKNYGSFIIQQYPWHYLRYFIWPNANKYFAPPVEFLQYYNSGRDSVTMLAQVWFRYKNKNISPRTNDLKINVLNFYPILSGMINIVMLFSLLCFIFFKGLRQQTRFRNGVLLSSIVWISNAFFTILASSAALRFQSFPLILTTIYSFLLIDWIWKLTTYTKRNLFNDYVNKIDNDNHNLNLQV